MVRNPQVFTQKPRTYFKRNLVENLLTITPEVYRVDDLDVSGMEIDPVDKVINSHIILAANQVPNVSAITDDPITSSIDTVSGLSRYFVKQNGLTEITPDVFERTILGPLGKSFRNFPTSAAFEDYIEDELLSGIRLNYPEKTFSSDLDPSASHVHLVSSISWLYFLNTSADGGLHFEPSNLSRDLMVQKLYRGETIKLNDCLKSYQEYVFKNYEVCAAWKNYPGVPIDYTSGTGTWVSGTQQLDKLKTLIDVAYSPLIFDNQDFRVRDAFEDYITNGLLLEDLISKGPFYRLLRAYSFAMADTKDEVAGIGTFNDILQCPEELLPLLAGVIGWDLFGSDPDRWRLQLLNAVDIYKKAGTKESIQVAVNSIFPREAFNVSGGIQELWESYVPHLIYYSIATESSVYKNFDNFTPEVARKLGVDSYSSSSMDLNLKIAVDNILLRLQQEFPGEFILAGKPFPVGDPSFKFQYRGRVFDMPPFEEIPYYVRTDITPDMILRIVDHLVCFGVRQDFAFQVGDFIRSNTIEATDDIRLENGWLMFTSSLQTPPNWENVLTDITPARDEFLGLWNGKSSHYQLDFESTSFDFSKNTLEIDSRLAIVEAARAADAFAPAHSIRDTRLFLSSVDYFTPSDLVPTYVVFDHEDIVSQYNSSGPGKGIPRYAVSGHQMNGYQRNRPGGLTPFQREEVDSVADTLLSGTSGAGDVILAPRNAYRRRGMEYSLQRFGMYTRTGFNMPISWDASTLEHSMPSSLGFLPLGFIPSSCSFQPIADYDNLPAVYHRCVTLNSSSVFSGVAASATFPCRGLSALGSDPKNTQYPDVAANYVDRGQLDPYVATVWSVDMQKEILVSSSDLSGSEGADGYSFGRNISKLHKDYSQKLGHHTLAKRITTENGGNIFAHTYGSIFENPDMQIDGAQAVVTPGLRASSTGGGDDATVYNVCGTGLSSLGGVSVDSTYLARGISGAPELERRTASIVSGVEYIFQEVSSTNDHITLYDISGGRTANFHANHNPLLKMKSERGFNRVAFDVNAYFEGDNRLIPDHEFVINLTAMIGNEDVLKKGGAKIGVWIRTGQQVNNHSDTSAGLIWSYTPRGIWEMEQSSNLTRDHVLSSLAHVFEFPFESRDVSSASGFDYNCVDSIVPTLPRNHAVISQYNSDEFHNLEITFNTKNKPIRVPERYHKDNSQVHRLDQNYRVEVFILPGNKNRFAVIDDVTLYDKTLNDYTKISVSSQGDITDPFLLNCSSLTVDLTPDQLWSILAQYNSMAGLASRRGLNSRVAATTSSIMDVSGGSRLNYRINPSWPGLNAPPTLTLLSAVDRYQNISMVN